MMANRVLEDETAVTLRASLSSSYPTWLGFVFIFNLIVGTGALTLPGVFAKAGWLLGLIVVILLAIISYITVTFIIEAMACANAVRNWQHLQFDNDSETDTTDASAALLPRRASEQSTSPATAGGNVLPTPNIGHAERMPLYPSHFTTQHFYRLDVKFELGEMATLFFSEIGRMLFYLCIAIYLYGDLSIYSTAIAKSMRDIICEFRNDSVPDNFTSYGGLAKIAQNADMDALCWHNHTMTRLNVYRLFLIGFTAIFGPFAAFSVQKTKYIQILTVVFRWLAFTFMIAIAIKLLLTNGAQGHPVAVNLYGLPALLGACVYSFMCHHSLPSILAPIRDKFSLHRIISYDYALICLLYIVLAITGIFAFAHIEDLYTLNFIPSQTEYSFKAELLLVIDYFLALFPVCTLSASYPIIAITLRNNLQTLFLDMTRFESYNYFVRRILFPLCAVIPPFGITYFTANLTSLVAFTGSYAGTGIQYLIPIGLVYSARRTCSELLGNGVVNDFSSPFRSNGWLLFVLLWAVACMCFVSINWFVDV